VRRAGQRIRGGIVPAPANGVEHESDDEDSESLVSVNNDLQCALGKRSPPHNADSHVAQRQCIASQSPHAQDSEDEGDVEDVELGEQEMLA